jgi:hypothetical protein
MAAKRHHTVPQLLLNRFADANGLVRVVERDDFSRWFETGTVGALAQKHFYTIDTDEGRDTGVEEDLLAKKVEAPAARALRRVVDEGVFPPMPGLRESLSIVFAFQFVHGPGMRTALLEHHEALAKMAASRATVESVRRYVKQDDGSELSGRLPSCLPTSTLSSTRPEILAFAPGRAHYPLASEQLAQVRGTALGQHA